MQQEEMLYQQLRNNKQWRLYPQKHNHFDVEVLERKFTELCTPHKNVILDVISSIAGRRKKRNYSRISFRTLYSSQGQGL